MMTAKYSVAITDATMKMMPLAASSPATRNDLCFHDTTNAAVARATAIIGTPVQTMPPVLVQALPTPPATQTLVPPITALPAKKAEPLQALPRSAPLPIRVLNLSWRKNFNSMYFRHCSHLIGNKVTTPLIYFWQKIILGSESQMLVVGMPHHDDYYCSLCFINPVPVKPEKSG
jgi:hypothetical protein